MAGKERDMYCKSLVASVLKSVVKENVLYHAGDDI